MNGNELAEFIIQHFETSNWDVSYALAPVSERWYTAELAAGLMRSGNYQYPSYRFYGEESYASLSKITDHKTSGLNLDEARNIPDLTLVQIEDRKLIFTVEAKIILEPVPNNIDFDPKHLGGQMRRAACFCPEAATYGLVVVIANHLTEGLSIEQRLMDSLDAQVRECADKNLNADIQKFGDSVKDKRFTLNYLENAWEKVEEKWSSSKDFQGFGIVVNSVINELQLEQQYKEEDDQDNHPHVEILTPYGVDAVRMFEKVQLNCTNAWDGKGKWLTNGIHPVPGKQKITITSGTGPSGVANLGIGLWQYRP